MNLVSDVVIFSIAFAVNLFIFGALLAGGLAVILRFTENIAPRLRYLVSIAVFLSAIIVPLAVTVFKDSIGQKAVIEIAENESRQKTINESPAQSNRVLIDKSDDSRLPPQSGKSNENLLMNFVLTVTNSVAGGIFLSIWIIGGFLLFLRMSVGIWRLEQSRKYWTRAGELDRKSLDCPNNITLYFVDDQAPGTIGWLRPAIVLPKEFPQGISLQAKRFIVRHELSHARWRDPFLHFLLRTLRNLFWISPALWLIERLIMTECEAAADGAAIDVSADNRNSQITALNYAETLLSIAKAFRSVELRNRQPQIVGIGAEADLEIRIRRLLSSRQTTRRQIGSAICACLITAIMTAVIPVASFSEIAQETKSQNFVSVDNQNNLPAIKNIDGSSVENSFDAVPPAKTFGESDEFAQSQLGLKGANDRNLPSNERTAISKLRQERRDLLSLSFGDESEKGLTEATNSADADEENQEKSRRDSSDLEATGNLPATGDFGTTASRLEYPELARKSSIILPNGDKPARPKTAGETGNRRDYSPNLPAPANAMKLSPYAVKYIPYAVGQREP